MSSEKVYLRHCMLYKFREDQSATQAIASSGWLDRFKARHNISFKVLSGEKNSADYESAEAFKEQFEKLMVGYVPENIFNLDDTALYTKLLPPKIVVIFVFLIS